MNRVIDYKIISNGTEYGFLYLLFTQLHCLSQSLDRILHQLMQNQKVCWVLQKDYDYLQWKSVAVTSCSKISVI